MADRFGTTRWSLIVNAGGEGPPARIALEALCRMYRSPVLAYVRAHSTHREDADELTQAFFAYLLEHRLAARADRERGKFRAFLLTSLKHFIAGERERASAQRRGGGAQMVALDDIDPPSDDGPEQAFEREWACTTLGIAQSRLQQEAIQAGKLELFQRLSPFLLEQPGENDYQQAADALGLRRNTVAVAVHRLRSRLQEVVRSVIEDSSDGPGDAAAELRRLRAALGASTAA